GRESNFGGVQIMKAKLVAALIAGLSFAGAAHADTIDNFFGNTLSATGQNGTARFLFNADGTFQIVQANGQTVAGTWTRQGSQICTTLGGQAQPCHDYAAHNVGDTWTETLPNGQTATFALTAGR